MGKKLNRETFRMSRLMDFFSEKELTAQIGHPKADWPLVAIKELIDNALDAAEDARVAPAIKITVDSSGITVTDNGPGIPPEAIAGILDFSVRVSSREAYCSPTRGTQGNALKTIIAMPFVLDGKEGRISITSRGIRHNVNLRVDSIRQEPIIEHKQAEHRLVKNGTVVNLPWPESACSILTTAKARFLQITDDYSFLNPHLSLSVDWFGDKEETKATAAGWAKWLPSDPTSSHWYTSIERLVSAYLAHDADNGRERTVREFVAEFHGLSGTAKQKAVLDQVGLHRVGLSALRNGNGLDHEKTSQLLAAMKAQSKTVKPAALGMLGREHVAKRFDNLGCEMDTFAYRKVTGETDGVPWVVETAFAWRPNSDRRLITGVNWSPGIINPFRQLGKLGESLDSILQEQRAGRDEPIVLLLHLACPRVTYTDRGKSAVVIAGEECLEGDL